MKPVTMITAGALLLLSLAALACSPEAQSSEIKGATSIEAIDQAIAAVAETDIASLVGQANFQTLECATVEGIGGPPPCLEDEAEGTEVDVLFAASCEGYYIRHDAVEAALNAFLGREPALHGVYRHNGLIFPSSQYVLVFDGNSALELGVGALQLFVSDDGITGINFGCGQTAESLVEMQALDDAILPPGR